jgi:hypothetical protein
LAKKPHDQRGQSKEQKQFIPPSGTRQAAEKRFQVVILSEAKNLALSIFKTMRDPSSPAAPQDDSPSEFFRSLQSRKARKVNT